jgi:hypothetical protein
MTQMQRKYQDIMPISVHDGYLPKDSEILPECDDSHSTECCLTFFLEVCIVKYNCKLKQTCCL